MTPSDETPEAREARLELEATCAGIGRTIIDILPPGVGFAMCLYDFGAKGNFAYIANCQREDFLAMLDEWRSKMRGQ